jgi:uncharacterized protein
MLWNMEKIISFNSVTMKQKAITTQVLTLLSILLFPVFGDAQERAGIFYKVTGNGLKDTSYLFGTYHLVNNSYLDELPAVQKAFNNANGVVVEIIMDTAKLRTANAAGMMQQSLTEMLDAPFRDSLNAELKSIGFDMQKVNNFKPVNVVLTLSIVHLIRSNGAVLRKYSGLPLDGYFAKTGASMGKSVTALETIEEQMNTLFNSASIEEQLQGLKSFVRNRKEMVRMGDELLNSWFAGDLTRMNELYETTLALSGEEDRLLKQRNLNWMKVLPALLEKQSQFIAVGALHLAGNYGLVALLRQKGYSVTAVKTKL